MNQEHRDISSTRRYGGICVGRTIIAIVIAFLAQSVGATGK